MTSLHQYSRVKDVVILVAVSGLPKWGAHSFRFAMHYVKPKDLPDTVVNRFRQGSSVMTSYRMTATPPKDRGPRMVFREDG